MRNERLKRNVVVLIAVRLKKMASGVKSLKSTKRGKYIENVENTLRTSKIQFHKQRAILELLRLANWARRWSCVVWVQPLQLRSAESGKVCWRNLSTRMISVYVHNVCYASSEF